MDIIDIDIAIAKALAGGGGGGGVSAFIVNASVSFDEVTGDPILDTIDKTLAEVRTAYTNGSDIKAKLTLQGDPTVYILPLCSIDMTDGADSTGAQFYIENPTIGNGSVEEMIVFKLGMFPNGNTFEAGSISFA